MTPLSMSWREFGALLWSDGVTLRFAPTASGEAVFIFLDDPGPDALRSAGVAADFEKRTITINLASTLPLDVARWERHLRESGLFVAPTPG